MNIVNYMKRKLKTESSNYKKEEENWIIVRYILLLTKKGGIGKLIIHKML